MKKNIVKLNESQLIQIVKESVKKVLKEDWRQSADDWSDKNVQAHYGIGSRSSQDDIDRIYREQADAYKKVVEDFEKIYGEGSFEQAREACDKLNACGLSAHGPITKHFTSDATKDFDRWKHGYDKNGNRTEDWARKGEKY